MTAPQRPRRDAAWDLNELERGATYRASTGRDVVVGEYLGIEAPHGDRAILIRHSAGTDSIPFRDVTSVERAAA